MPCQAECLGEYSCSSPQKPIKGTSFAPYVKVGFSGDGEFITVGNKSAPPGNHAVIKSFQYGGQNGQGVELEIFDEEGSNFSKFMDRLNKTMSRAPEDYRMFVEWGWIISDCNGNAPKLYKTTDFGGPLYFLPREIKMAFEQGKIKYTLIGADFMDRIAENRIDKNIGTEANKIALKPAIRRLFSENDPKVPTIKFQRPDGSEWCFLNSDGGCDGPKAVWTTDQQNALTTVRKWIRGLTTDEGKGVEMTWNPENGGTPEIILWEGNNPAPGESPDCCVKNIGTYIVNGGDCSPVISFSPSVNWTLGTLAGSGGGMSAGRAGNTTDQDGEPGSNRERVGTTTHIVGNNNEDQWRSGQSSAEKNKKAQAAHEKATADNEVPKSIEAELKIQGDPTIIPIASNGWLRGATVSIIVINPFYVKQDGSLGNCRWLAEPQCNNIFSNKSWLVLGVNHQIQEGNYVTTLKVTLRAPGVDLEGDTAAGGPGCGTWTPANAMGTGD